MNNRRFAEEITDRIKMSEMFQRYGYRPNKMGFISCPFHREKTASMKPYKGDKQFHCFGCGKTGSIIDFVMLYDNLSFQDAITQINHNFGLNLPIGERISLRQKREIEKNQRERQQKRLAEELEQQEIEEAYWVIFGEWKRLDDNKRNYRPRSTEEEFHPLYVEALHRLPYQEYLLEIAEQVRG